MAVSMPHAAFYVVQLVTVHGGQFHAVSMPHAAFYVVQLGVSGKYLSEMVSMPHAAFYVVQQPEDAAEWFAKRFQCRTQHFMWCNEMS